MRTDDQTKDEFFATDPRDGSMLGAYESAAPSAVAAAVMRAVNAAIDDRLKDDILRADLLRGVARGLRDDGSAIIAMASAETGLPDVRLQGELERTARQLEAFAALIEKGEYVDAFIDPADPTAEPIPRPDIRRMLVPIGPVAVFGASNFPLAFSVAGGDTASALAAGCPVVVKGHPAHPGTGALVARTIERTVEEVGLPGGTFTFLPAGGSDVGEELVDQAGIAAVAFTGSFRAGNSLRLRAAARDVPIPVYAEMSSSNPLVVTPGALNARREAIAEGLALAVGGSAGQLCTKPGLLFVPAGDEWVALRQEVSRRLAEQGEYVMLTRGIRDALLAREEAIGDLADSVVLAPGETSGKGAQATAALYATDAESLVREAALREEAFGPVAVFVTYDDDEQLVAALSSLDGQLTGTLHLEADEVDAVRPIVQVLGERVGRLIFNGYPTGVAVTHAMHHGGPFPATTDAAATSVGMTAINRFLRPLAWQDAPEELLPAELRDGNRRGIFRRIDGELER